MRDALVTALFRALVHRIGGVDAAEACLRARWGQASKGHISAMCGGAVAVTVEAVEALEDALGEAPVTEYLALRMGGAQAPVCARTVQNLMAHAQMAAAQAQMVMARAVLHEGPGGAEITAPEAAEIGAAAVDLRRIVDDLVGVVQRIGAPGQAGGGA